VVLLSLPLLFLALLPARPGEGFADLVPVLTRLTEQDARGRPLVGDEHVAAIEARLGAFLGLVEDLRVSLTAEDGSRRDVLATDAISVRVVRRGAPRTLFELSVSVDGERVTREHFTFVDPTGRASATRALVERRGAPPHPLASLPLYFERLRGLLAAVDERGLELVSLQPGNGDPRATPPYADARYTVAPRGSGDSRRLSAFAVLLLDARAPADRAPTTRVGADEVTVPALARAVARPFSEVLDSGALVLDALAFPFPCALGLADDPFGVNNGLVPLDNLAFEVQHAGRTLTRARLWRDGSTPGWHVTEWTGKRLAESVPLAHYVALASAAVALAEAREESIGALALSGARQGGATSDVSTALLLTLWGNALRDAPAATAHVLEAHGGEPVRRLESVALVPTRPEGPASSTSFRATAADGRSFELRTGGIACGTEADPVPPVRFGEVTALLLGGTSMPDAPPWR
jgi:hypothetical protein